MAADTYRAELEVASYEALRQFLDAVSDDLVAPDEKRDLRRLAETGDVEWPCQMVFELDATEWQAFSAANPDQARVLEPHFQPHASEE